MASERDLKLRVVFDMVERVTKPLRHILDGNRDLAKSLKASRDQLGKLQKAQHDVATFRELRRGLIGAERAVDDARARVAELAAGIQASSAPTRRMSAEFERAKRTAAKLAIEHERQADKVRALRTQLSAADIDTRRLADHERRLRNNIATATAAMAAQENRLSALTARTKQLADARERMHRWQARAGAMAHTGTKAIAAGAAVGATTLAPVAAYARAEESATHLAGALMRAGGIVPPEFEKINALALRLGDRLPGTTAHFQDMMTMLARQGISAQAVLGGMGEATAYLAVQLGKTPAEAAEFTAKLQDATRTAEADMLALTDVIQKAFYLGVDDGNLLQGFAKLGPALDTIRLKGLAGAKALAPLLVMADQAGMDGSAAGNAYRKVLQLSMDAARVAKARRAAGGRIALDFTNGRGEFGGLEQMLRQFEKLKRLSTQQRLSVTKKLFGDDAETLQAVALLIDKGQAGYAEVQAKMAAQASLQERVNQQLGTLKNLWDAASGTFVNALAAVGAAIAPEARAVTEWLGDIAQRLRRWASENPRLANGLLKLTAALGVLLAVGGGVVVVLAGILGPLAILRFSMTVLGVQGGILAHALGGVAAVFRLLGGAILFAGRALLMNPVGVALSAALLIYRYWTPIKGFFAELWTRVRATFASVFSWFGVALPARFSAFGANLLASFAGGIRSALGTVKSAVMNAADATVNWFKDKLGIHSPSRVFATLGGFVGQGMALGVALGIAGEQPRIARAAASLAGAAALSFAAPAAGSFAREHVPIDSRPVLSAAPRAPHANALGVSSIVVNVYAPAGADPVEIGRMVRAELERVERANQARRGSRLSD
jgi:TP901 family phage tail tape measure protein